MRSWRRWVARRACAAPVLALCVACGSDSRRAATSSEQPALVSAPPPRSAPAAAGDLRLRARPGSIKFAVIGDSGRGSRAQYDVAEEMIAYRRKLRYDFVLMLGDNVYDRGTPEDYQLKFELPLQAADRFGPQRASPIRTSGSCQTLARRRAASRHAACVDGNSIARDLTGVWSPAGSDSGSPVVASAAHPLAITAAATIARSPAVIILSWNRATTAPPRRARVGLVCGCERG